LADIVPAWCQLYDNVLSRIIAQQPPHSITRCVHGADYDRTAVCGVSSSVGFGQARVGRGD
jgi:hypothetical protein